MLRQDHMKVKELFRQFESTESNRERKAIADTAILELDIHSRLEEEIFYPSVRRISKGGEEIGELMSEAEEEHHVVDVLSQELMKMQPEDPEFAAKFKVMAENVEHHIEEEESQVLPQAEELGPDRLNELGAQMEQRRQQLLSANNGRASRARSASRTGTPTRTRASGAHRSRTGKPAAARSGSRSGSGSRTKGKSRSK
jgi:hypothetical protein